MDRKETALEEQCAETVTEHAAESKEEKKLEISEGELPQVLEKEQTTAGVGERQTEVSLAGDRDSGKLTTVSQSSGLSDSQRSGERTDEGQIVLELPYLAEAAAFLAFKKTVSELDSATKQLAGVLLGPNWLTDKKKRRELPAFIRDTSRTKSKHLECTWSTFDIFSVLLWLETKLDITKFDNDEKVVDAREKCKSSCENVKEITLLDAWKDHCPVPSPEDIASDLTRYSSVLNTLGCIDAACTVQESVSWILEKQTKLQQSLQTEGPLNIMESVIVDQDLAEIAVVFKAYHYVDEYLYEYCRDRERHLSQFCAALLKERNDQPLGLYELLSALGEKAEMLSEAKRTALLEFSSSLTPFAKHLVQQFSGLPSWRRSVLSFWKTLDALRSILEWEEFRHQKRRKDISRLLDELITNGSGQERKEEILLKVYFPSLHFNPRKLHNWILPNMEKFIGRKKELSQICDSLEKQAGTVLITGPSGIGKSCLAREAAFRLRTAWPSQFVLDMSTFTCFMETYCEMTLNSIFSANPKNTNKFNINVENGNHRVLLVIENVDSSQMMRFLEVPVQPTVSTIVVARRLEGLTPFSKIIRKRLSVNILLSSFSPEDTLETLKQSFPFQLDDLRQVSSGRESYAKADTGDCSPSSASETDQLSPKTYLCEDASSIETFLAYISSATKGFPVAVGLASKLLLNFPRQCFHRLQNFLEERRALSIDNEMTALAFTSENATALMEMACFAIALIEPRKDLQSLLHTMSLLACPTVPMLRSLLAEVCKDVKHPQEKLGELEDFGLLICNNEEKEPMIHMNALVSHAIQSTISLPEFGVVTECYQALWQHVMRISNAELSGTTRCACRIVCTASRFHENFLLSVLSDETKPLDEDCMAVFLLQSVLSGFLAKFHCTDPRLSSFTLSLEHACDLYMTTLGIFIHVKDAKEFRDIFPGYRDYALAGIRQEVYFTRVYELLLLVLASQGKDMELLAEKDCAAIALLSAQTTVVGGELPWMELYLNFAERSGAGQYHPSQSPRKLDKAKKYSCRFVKENKVCFVQESQEYALGLQRQAMDYQQKGERQKAMECFMEALPILEHSGRASDIIPTLEILWDVGGVTMLDQSSHSFSRFQLLKALGIARKAFGEKSAHCTTALCKLAELEYALGIQAKAVEFRNLISLRVFQHKLGGSEDESSPVSPSNTSKKIKKRKNKKKWKASAEWFFFKLWQTLEFLFLKICRSANVEDKSLTEIIAWLRLTISMHAPFVCLCVCLFGYCVSHVWWLLFNKKRCVMPIWDSWSSQVRKLNCRVWKSLCCCEVCWISESYVL